MLASPVANAMMPQASDRPTFEPVAAGPADTGPFILSVTGANTGPLPMAQPANNTAQVTASSRGFIMDILPSLRTRRLRDQASRFGTLFHRVCCRREGFSALLERHVPATRRRPGLG